MDIQDKKNSNRCPLCGGRLTSGPATIPFLLKGTVIVIKDVPAKICAECSEPFLAGVATDAVVELLNGLQSLNTEVSVVSYPRPARDAVLDVASDAAIAAQMA